MKPTRPLLLAAFLALSATVLIAQPDTSARRWMRVDIEVEGPLPRLPFAQQQLHPLVQFASPRIGFALLDKEIAFTYDGGESWNLGDVDAPRPRRMIDSAFGLSMNRMVTYDGARTWRKPPLPTDVDSVLSFDAGTRMHFAVRYRSTPLRFDRLAYTIDGGASWNWADTILTEVAGRSWMGDVRFITATTFVIGAIEGDRRPAVLIDAVTGRASWKYSPGPTMPYFFDERTGYFTAHHSWGVEYYGTIVVATEDGGATWTARDTSWGDAYHLPHPEEYPYFPGLRILTPTYWITPDAVSTDAGRTWWPRAVHPFSVTSSPTELVYGGYAWGVSHFVLDSLHRFAAGAWGLFARSSDGGRTWQRSAPGGNATAVAARGEHLLVAREYQSLSYSFDAGESWSDAGLEGGLPANLRQIHEIVYRDSVDPARLYAVGDFTSIDTGAYVGVVASVDSGRSWRAIGRLPSYVGYAWGTGSGNGFDDLQLELESGDDDSLVAFLSTGDGLWRSDDGLRTWTRSGPEAFDVSMIDALHGSIVGDWFVHTTTDGGATWSRGTLSRSGHRSVIHAGPDSTVSVYLIDWNFTGPPPILLSTSTDRGRTWDTVSAPMPAWAPGVTVAPYLAIVDTSVYLFDEDATICRAALGSLDFQVIRPRDTADSDLRRTERRPLISPIGTPSTDQRYVYIAGRNDAVGRWTLGAPPPPPPPAAVGSEGARRVSVAVVDGIIVAQAPHATGAVRVELYDALGRLVAIEHGELNGALRLAPVTSGMYVVRVVVDGASTSTPVIIIR